MSSFTTVLVANRGEIACRVFRSAKALGYRTVAVYSDADADALHVRLADVATRIGPAPVKESYLSIEAILEAAKRTGADAIHPGYGFLSENDVFAKACEDAGLTFIGPTPAAILAMGNKAHSKRLMIEAKVPTIPGWQGDDQSEATLARAADEVGYPLLIKASAGGGGRGMRLVHAKDEFLSAYRTAKAEAENAFGSGEVLLERALLDARHVEIQVFADKHGNVIHLGERDCSIQRRHQKIVEESPSPAVNAELRARMGEAGAAAARSIGYVGAGTVEFLLDADGSFYFLEMNTRLQVEHPVTEMVTGLDLVALQLRVAAGEVLPIAQSDVKLEGHAIEVRLYAEDPYGGFLPQTGRIERFRPGVEGSTEGRVTNGMRVDHGLVEGQEVSPWYDPMLAKLIAWGKDRDEAQRRILRLLSDTQLLGTTTNKTFLYDVLSHPAFARGEATTKFIPTHFVPEGKECPDAPETAPWARALAALLLSQRDRRSLVTASTGSNRWNLRVLEGASHTDVVVVVTASEVVVTLGAVNVTLQIVEQSDESVRVLEGGVLRTVPYVHRGDHVYLDLGGRAARFEEVRAFVTKREAVGGDGRVLAPMNGRIVSVHVEVGAIVKRGELVAVLEAMKMQHQVLADIDGTVTEVVVAANDQVAPKKLLVQIQPNPA
jgi:geranyl-CoA carboxylase alpha subunit